MTNATASATATAAAPSVNAFGSGSGAAHALALLLREDPLLVRHGLVDGGVGGVGGEADSDDGGGNNAAHSYAAALLHVGGHHDPASSSSSSSSSSAKWLTSSGGEYRQRATEALADVDRKLALVESLSQRISREAPEMVAGPLLRSHGFELASLPAEGGGGGVERRKKGGAGAGGNAPPPSSAADDRGSSTPATTLAAARDKAERIARQSQLLDAVARRVESTLRRGATRMESATARLSRVLELSATLKMMLRLQFEARKVLHAGGSGAGVGTTGGGVAASPFGGGCGLDGFVDLRDLTRAAASVAAMEGLLAHPSLTPERKNGGGGGGRIDAVERLRPRSEAVAASVRRSAAGLMDELQRGHPTASGTAASLTSLGATLQVYFHLGEVREF
jgi:hypothetical protein